MELMRRRGQQKLNPEKLGCNIVPKLFCWLPKLYYRGVSLEFLDYVLETTTADGKFCLVSFIDPFYYADPNEFCTQCLRPYRSDAYSGGMVDPRLVKPFDYRFMDFLSCQESALLRARLISLIRKSVLARFKPPARMQMQLSDSDDDESSDCPSSPAYCPNSPAWRNPLTSSVAVATSDSDTCIFSSDSDSD